MHRVFSLVALAATFFLIGITAAEHLSLDGRSVAVLIAIGLLALSVVVLLDGGDR